MKKLVVLLVLALGFVTQSIGQEYNSAIGIRGGLSNGLTYKTFISQNTALEFLLATRWHGINITALNEIHAQAFDTDGLNWYYGFGAHVGFWNGKDVDWADDNESYTVLGIDGIIGLEYNFKDVPINISLDWKPAFNLIGNSDFWGDGGAFSIRYIF